MARPKSQPYQHPKSQVEFTPERKEMFLEHMRETGSQVLSAVHAGVAARTVQDHVAKDKQFAEAYVEAYNYHTDYVWKKAAYKRAIEGVKKPIIGGKDRDIVVTHVTEYSDALTLGMLRARDAEFSLGAGSSKGGGGGGGGGLGGGGGGILIVPYPPPTKAEWEAQFGEAARGTTGLPENP